MGQNIWGEGGRIPHSPWICTPGNSGNFWELSDGVLNRMESGNYLENKLKHNMYLKENPFVAKKKFINIH